MIKNSCNLYLCFLNLKNPEPAGQKFSFYVIYLTLLVLDELEKFPEIYSKNDSANSSEQVAVIKLAEKMKGFVLK